ncbi:MAG: SMP-30/gluconolactonase/LRE family protein [Bryobacteraceae bacterium]
MRPAFWTLQCSVSILVRSNLTRWLFGAAMGAPPPGSTRLPVSQKLSAADRELVQTEIQRLERRLATDSDQATVMYAIARTWAAAGQYRETMDWLRRVVALNMGLDPSRDSAFVKIRNVTEYQNLMRRVRSRTLPVLRSQIAFHIEEADLFPEGIAYDPLGKRFYLGSTKKRKIVRCAANGTCETFVEPGRDGLGEVLGLKVQAGRRALWATSNSAGKCGLFCYDLRSGRLIREYFVSGGDTAHEFNDLAVTARGDVFATDTRANTVWRVSHKTDSLEPLPLDRPIQFPNGIALSDDEKKLYVAGFGDGISVVDLASGKSQAIGRPSNLCLATIDGLCYSRGSLVAIQNGVMTPRVVQLRLSQDENAIESFEILERRNPLFDGITTGAIANGNFYYMANTQLDRAGCQSVGPPLHPIAILKVALKNSGAR